MEMESILVGEADCEIFGGGGTMKNCERSTQKNIFPKDNLVKEY